MQAAAINITRSRVMSLAWDLYRTAATSSDPRTFADALRGAWRFTKKMAAAPAPRWAREGGRVRFTSLIRSPTDRSRGGDYVSTRDGSARTTSFVGR